MIERSTVILSSASRFGMIVPMSLVSTTRVALIRDMLLKEMATLYISNYSGDAHPSVLFNGVKMRLSIVIAKKKSAASSSTKLQTTNFLRWYAEAREYLFTNNVNYIESPLDAIHNGLIPKIGNNIELRIWNKIFSQEKQINRFVYDLGANSIYSHRIVAHFVKCFDFVPHFWNETDGQKKSEDYKVFSFKSHAEAVSISATINSTIFYHYYLLYSDAYHCGRELILTFPLNLETMDSAIIDKLHELNSILMNDMQQNSKRRKIQYRTGWIEYDEFYPRHSKHIIDEIDRVLAQHYGFTDEELDFIINYDIKYRMGGDLGGDEENGEDEA